MSFSNLGKLADATVLQCCLRPDSSGCDCGPMEKGKVYLINCSGNSCILNSFLHKRIFVDYTNPHKILINLEIYILHKEIST